MQRTRIALAFAAGALFTCAYALYVGSTCGVSVSPACEPGADCPASTCSPWVHPFMPAYAVASLAAFGMVWRERAWGLLVMGVLGAAFGTLAGFSLGPIGILVSFLLVGAGVALAPRHPVAWTALVAALAPLPALIVLSQMGPRGILAAWLVAFMPALLWLALSAWWVQKREGEVKVAK